MFLERIGADSRVRELFHPYDAEGRELARVSFAAHEQYRVYLENGEFEAVPAGRLRWEAELPAVGDWVAARRVDAALALIEAVLPRRTAFSRRSAGSAQAEQIVAANIDVALIVCGLDHDFNLRRLERYLVLTRESGAQPVVVLNKADVCVETGERLESARRVSGSATVLAISAHQSVESLREWIRGRTVAFLGSSGAGKSTIANALLGEQRQVTAAVRADDSRGRHTTTSRMLIPLPQGGALIDNPGMRELQLWATEDSLDDVFAEIAMLAKSCRYADCTHYGEPDCAVREALESGELDAPRFASYRKLEAEIRYQKVKEDPEAQAAQKAKWKIIHKAMRHHPKYRR
jgi:ribosome biogenesis GTPase